MFYRHIIIVEKDTITSKDEEVIEKLKNFFIEAVENLEVEPFVPNLDNNINTESLGEILKKYEGNPSILKIRENVNVENKFIFNEELQNNDNSITTHDRNLQRLATEIYKIKNQLSPFPMQGLFTEKVNTHDLRNNRTWESQNVRTVSYGTEIISNVGPKI